MAVVIDLQGEFGWEIRPKTVARKLARVNGEDVIVRLSSIGGDVFDGADVVNLFLDFRRDNPSVNMTLEIKAIAASYGSALMAADIWDDIGISSVSAVMIHRASTFAYVNSVEAESLIRFLSGLDNMYSQMYADRTGETQDAMLEAMTDETWYFGQEIIDSGFADRIITMDDEGGDPLPVAEGDEGGNIFIVDFKNQREAMMQKMAEEKRSFDVKRAAACLRTPEQEPKKPKLKKPETGEGKPNTDQNKTPAPAGNLRTEVPMNIEELKKDHPDLYAAMKAEGAKEFRESNDERVKALSEMKKNERYSKFPELIAVIDEGIMSDKGKDEVLTELNAEMLNIMNDPAKMAALESAGDIGGGDSPAPEMKSKPTTVEV